MITVKDHKLQFLQKKFKKYVTYIYNFQKHVDRCFSENIININNRNSYLTNLNNLLRSLNVCHNTKVSEIWDNNDLSCIDRVKEESYSSFEYLSKIRDISNIKNNNMFDDPFLDINKELIKFGSKIGFWNLEHALEIIVGEYYKKMFNKTTFSIIDIYIPFFVPIKYSYKTINDTRLIYAEKIKSINEAIINGCLKIYIKHPSENYYMVFQGYFINDSLNIIYRTSEICNKYLYNKRRNIEEKLKKYKIDNKFKCLYIKNVLLLDFIVLSDNEFIEQLDKEYKYFKFLTRLKMIDLMEEFSNVIGTESIEKIYTIIRLLLMGSKENINLAGVLFDTLKDRRGKNDKLSNIIYKNLNYVSQIKLKYSRNSIKCEIDKLKSNVEEIDFEKQIALCKYMPDNVKRAASVKLNEIKLSNNEQSKQILYVKTLINYPWPSKEDDTLFIDIGKNKKRSREYLNSIETTLNSMIYGHDECKSTICELVSKWLSNPSSAGGIFGLGGPPGVGKTLIAKSIGDALNIPCAQITLGGENDSEILHGHGYTYSAAQPGMIIKKMIEAGSSRCIIYFDELDKACVKIKNNEIFNKLIHITDPETNDKFQDRFFQEINFSLRNVIFIFSYNDRSKIDRVLMDRIEHIDIKPFTIKDKKIIAQKFLLKDLCKEIGFNRKSIVFPDKVIEYIADRYTNEPGVRKLKRKIEKILLKLNKDKIFNIGLFKDNNNISENNPLVITKKIVERYLDKPYGTIRKVHNEDKIGIINGMYATNNGEGGIQPVQIFPNISSSHNKFKLVFSGCQKKITKDSTLPSLTAATNIVDKNILNNYLIKNKHGFHIHTPSSAVPKDGPSAGAAYAAAMVSVILNIKIKHDIAVTGEIESTGKITKIGGLEYKLPGIKKAGVRLALVPIENKQDVEKICKKDKGLVTKNFQIKYVSYLKDLLKLILVNYDQSLFSN